MCIECVEECVYNMLRMCLRVCLECVESIYIRVFRVCVYECMFTCVGQSLFKSVLWIRVYGEGI
jgi:hypothetical protein